MVVGPGGLQLVGQFLNRLRALRSKDEKTNRRRTDTANNKKKLLHRVHTCFLWSLGCCLEATGSLAILWNGELHFSMDSVRFGRALGLGARSAAKALVMAADAASAPAPRGKTATVPKQTEIGERASIHAAAQAAVKVRASQAGLARGGKRFGEAVWSPFVRLSGVLWLELTGVFFGLFLLTALVSAWKLRGSLHDTGMNHLEHQRLLWSIAMAIVFGYFSISSFVRAARRERRR